MSEITEAMKKGLVNYADTFIDGKIQNQRATEQKMLEAIRYYSAVENQDFMRGILIANQIIKGDRATPKNTGRL